MSSPDLPDVRRDFGFSLCAVPLSDSCPKILEWGDQKIGVSIRVVLRVEPRDWNKQKDKLENKKQTKSMENKEFVVLRVVTSRVQQL